MNTDVVNPVKSNQPIRILKRPTSQSQVPSAAPMTSPFADQISSEDTVPSPTLIPRHTHRTNKAQIKTYEQRETEYRLARLRYLSLSRSRSSSTYFLLESWAKKKVKRVQLQLYKRSKKRKSIHQRHVRLRHDICVSLSLFSKLNKIKRSSRSKGHDCRFSHSSISL